MGLDITFYEETKRLDPHPRLVVDDNGEHYCEHPRVWLWSLHERPETFVFTQRGIDAEYCFESIGRTASWHSSYGGYSIFRGALMGLVRPDLLESKPHLHQFYPRFWDLHPEEAEAIPFAELFDFADNEGTYGPEAATALLADFRAYEDRVGELGQHFPAWADEFPRMYHEYLNGLRIVGSSGLVDYH